MDDIKAETPNESVDAQKTTRTRRSRKAADAPDVFDEAIADRKAAQDQTLQDALAEQQAAVGEDEQPKRASKFKLRPRLPDPFGSSIIALSDDKNAEEARLLRSNDNDAMLIQFTYNPGKEITDQLREAGLYWEPKARTDFANGAWIIKFEEGREWQTHAHADRVFQAVVNQIRESNGMEPFMPGAAQAV